MEKFLTLVILFFVTVAEVFASKIGKRVHVVHWNQANPMFRIDNTDNVIDVNVGNTRWEYDQANFICPKSNNDNEDGEYEKYIIYSVSKEEYDSCMVYRPTSRVVGSCTRPGELSYFTISFRSFTPIPGGLEFRPGQDYYFITTSSPNNLHGKNGGRCKTHNMKVIFKVAPNSSRQVPKTTTVSSTTTTSSETQVFFDDKNKYYPVMQKHQPRNIDSEDEDEENTLETARKVVRDFQLKAKKQKSFAQQNEVIKQEASRMHSEAAVFSKPSYSALLLIFLTLMHHGGGDLLLL